MNKIFIFFLIIFFCSCSANKEKLFEKLSAYQTGIKFQNTLSYNDDFNIFTYRNYYNGGGVGLGDINNDGLLDIYFTSNLNENKLYLNIGNFKFACLDEKTDPKAIFSGL